MFTTLRFKALLFLPIYFFNSTTISQVSFETAENFMKKRCIDIEMEYVDGNSYQFNEDIKLYIFLIHKSGTYCVSSISQLELKVISSDCKGIEKKTEYYELFSENSSQLLTPTIGASGMETIEGNYGSQKGIIVGDIEIMKKDLGKMRWRDAYILSQSYKDGWRLPTKEELEILYKRKNVGSFVENEWYWGSEHTTISAWAGIMYSSAFDYDKQELLNVRLVRSTQ